MPAAIEEAAPRPEGREPAEDDAEEVEEEDAGDEGRRRNADDADHDHRPVQPRAASEGGEHAEGDAGDEHDDRPHEAQIDGQAETVADHGDDGAVSGDRAAEVASDHLTEPLAVLNEERIVQVKLLADRRDGLGIGRTRADQRADRVARREFHQGEHAERDQEEERHGDGEAPQDEIEEPRPRHRPSRR